MLLRRFSQSDRRAVGRTARPRSSPCRQESMATCPDQKLATGTDRHASASSRPAARECRRAASDFSWATRTGRRASMTEESADRSAGGTRCDRCGHRGIGGSIRQRTAARPAPSIDPCIWKLQMDAAGRIAGRCIGELEKRGVSN